ncbi:PrsW family intramembrane metalloprotease [Leptolyngbya ohadii]|uniref:PrsW family intramembrane metalloprotease n=1 Tax=Leptolyngbya ohadii TaxID=1962290 RepID=UPI000B5A0DB5|nr:PrsW family glutamic-type intramembrane protease [Leptolyngbya ohadii]
MTQPDRKNGNLPARRKISLTALFPYQKIFRPELYRSAIVRLLLFLGLVPLAINLLAAQVPLSHVAWLTGIYCAIVWALLLYHLIQPTRVSWKRTIAGVLFTVFISIPVLLMVQRLPPFNLLYGAVGQGLSGRLVGFVLGVGVLEEICKAIPVLLMIAVRPKNLRPRNRRSPDSSPNLQLPDPRTAAFYGAMCGLGFAVAESGAYSVQYAIALMRGQLDLGLYLAANTIRFVSLPLFHAVLTGIVGYFIGLSLEYPGEYSGRRLLLGVGLAIVAVLHGLYNAFSGGLSGLAIIGFSLALFIAYLDADSSPRRGS